MIERGRRAVAVSLAFAAVAGVLNVGTAQAHAPLAGATQSEGYASIFGHDRSIRVQLMNTLRNNYSFLLTDYNNARGHVNDSVASYTPGSPYYVDNIPGDPQTPDVWIVEAGSSDENILNYVYGFIPCSSSTAWGKVYSQTLYGAAGDWHTVQQKICIWPSRIGGCDSCRLNTNGQGLRYQYLTLEHEMSHVAQLAHPNGDGHGALMNDGTSMLEMNTYERDAIRNHF